MTLNITATGVIWWCLREPTWLVRPGGLVCRWFCEVSRYLLEVEPKAEISRRDSVANCLSLSASHFLFWLFGSSWWGQQLSGVGTFFMVCENARGPDKTTGWEFCSGPVGKREKIFAKKKKKTMDAESKMDQIPCRSESIALPMGNWTMGAASREEE